MKVLLRLSLLLALQMLPLMVFGQITWLPNPTFKTPDKSFKVIQVLDNHKSLIRAKDIYNGKTYLLWNEDENYPIFDDLLLYAKSGNSVLIVGTYHDASQTIPVIRMTDLVSEFEQTDSHNNNRQMGDTIIPMFPGGDAALMQFLAKNVKYPVKAEEKGIQGRVVVTFYVEEDGSISDVQVEKSVHPSLDKEAIRVVKSMPRWTPARKGSEAIRFKCTTPVTFRLQ